MPSARLAGSASPMLTNAYVKLGLQGRAPVSSTNRFAEAAAAVATEIGGLPTS